MASIEYICNQALDLIGYERKIGQIYEGSRAANVALDFYVQTRDELLRETKPDWAKIDIGLTLNKSAPNIVNGMADYTGLTWSSDYPPLPWLYEYAYPTDCVEPLQIKFPAQFVPQWRPQYAPFRLMFAAQGNNNVILCNVPNAILIYITQVLDPGDWHNDFVELMVGTLAKKFQGPLGHRQTPKESNEQSNNSN